jgi:hypothetical protein
VNEGDEGTNFFTCGVCLKPADAAAVPAEVALASNEELLIELLSRFEHGIFVAVKPLGNEPAAAEYKTMTYRRWVGNSLVTQGLCIETAHIIAEDYIARRVDCDDVGRSID